MRKQNEIVKKGNQPGTRRGTPDFLLLLLTFSLVCFGLAFVFSSSIAIDSEGSLSLGAKHVINIVLGTFMMLVCMNVDYRMLQKWNLFIFVSVVILLMITPIIGKEINNAKSWIVIGGFTLQPTELAKLMMIIYLANLITKKGDLISDFKRGFVPPLLVVGFISATIMLQPDLGSTAILIVVSLIVLFVGGASLKHFLFIGFSGGFLAGIGLILYLLGGATDGDNYRLHRFTTFFDPWSDPAGRGYQIIQAMYAFGHGGVLGTGFGKSVQKLHYLPLPYNDFIFPVIGEELGFVGTLLFLLVYLGFIWRGLIVALRSKEPFGLLVGVGIISMIGVQAFVNMGGVTNTIPMTGVTLPLISYGGTSMLVTLASMGILLNISRDMNKERN